VGPLDCITAAKLPRPRFMAVNHRNFRFAKVAEATRKTRFSYTHSQRHPLRQDVATSLTIPLILPKY
jgi:hypothetical protein